MPSERNASVDSLDELGVSSLGVGVTHVVQDGDTERSGITGGSSGLESESLGWGGTVTSGDCVVVGCPGLESSDLDIVEELGAKGNSVIGRARRGSVVATSSALIPFACDSRSGVALDVGVHVVHVGTVVDTWLSIDAKGGGEVNTDSTWNVGQGNGVDVVGGIGSRWPNGWGFEQSGEALLAADTIGTGVSVLRVTVDGLVRPIGDRDGWTGIRVIGKDVPLSPDEHGL